MAEFRGAFPELGSADWACLERFQGLVVAAPRGISGFRPEDVAEQIARSLLLARLFSGSHRVIDVGSGAGFPGIPLAVVLRRVWLLEPHRKAVAFLERAVRELGLEATVVPLSAEDAGRREWRESSDGVVARALAPPAAAFELLAPLCSPGGQVVVTGAPEGLRDLPQVHPGLGLGNFRTETLKSGIDLSQTVHIMDKLTPTSEEFPRRPGRARKR